jgi:hypothetical protein
MRSIDMQRSYIEERLSSPAYIQATIEEFALTNGIKFKSTKRNAKQPSGSVTLYGMNNMRIFIQFSTIKYREYIKFVRSTDNNIEGIINIDDIDFNTMTLDQFYQMLQRNINTLANL